MTAVEMATRLQSRKTWWYEKGIRTCVYQGVAHLHRSCRYGPPIAATAVSLLAGDWAASLVLVESAAECLLMKKIERKVSGGTDTPMRDPSMEKVCPTLWQFLTDRTYDDGSKREPGSLLAFCQDGVIKLMLRDRDAGLCLWIASRTLSDAFKAAEGGLTNPDAEWRVDRQQEGQQASRRKRAS